MCPILLTVALVSATFQKPASNNTLFPDVPDNHFAYDVVKELKADGLLPEYDVLLRGNKPLTRGQFGQYITEATINLQRFVDDNRVSTTSQGAITYSDQLSNLTGDQLKNLFALVPRMRRLAKAFSVNLPSFVKWAELDHALEEEGKLVDGLTAGP